MTLTGTLLDFDLFSIFNMIKLQNKIGVLLIENENTRVKIYFDRGYVVGVDSSQCLPEESVAYMLLRSNKISFEEMQNIIQEHNKGLKHMEEIILESGVVTEHDIQDIIHKQIMNNIYKVFLWTSGNYQFDSIITDGVKNEIFRPISVEAILIGAAKLLDEWPQTQKRLPDRFQVLSMSSSAETFLQNSNKDISKDITVLLDSNDLKRFNAMRLTREEENVLHYFERPNSTDSVIKVSKYNEWDTCKHIVSLMEKGLLEITSQKPGDPHGIMRQMTDIQKIQAKIHQKPSALFWPLTAFFIIMPIIQYAPRTKESLNRGLISVYRHNTQQIKNAQTEERAALVSILYNAKSENGTLVIPSAPSQNAFINQEVKKLFSQYRRDPLSPPRSNFENEINTTEDRQGEYR